MTESLAKNPLPGQVSRFAVIGLIASALHVAIASGFFYGFDFNPLTANFMGFLFAWFLSFAGHYLWTFERGSTMWQAMPRFLLVSVFGLCLNQVIVWFVVDVFDESFSLAMALVIVIIPVTSFIFSKFWVFRATGYLE